MFLCLGSNESVSAFSAFSTSQENLGREHAAAAAHLKLYFPSPCFSEMPFSV